MLKIVFCRDFIFKYFANLDFRNFHIILMLSIYPKIRFSRF